MDVTAAVEARYGAAAQQREEALCCPIADYDPRLLEAIPTAVLDRDYGCGDPSRFVEPGDTVLDLGSGGGKICFIASQIVGAEGRVIGVDRNRDMLALACEAAPQVAERVGYANVEFRVGNIQDLALDLNAMDAWLAEHPVHRREDYFALLDEQERLRREAPLVADSSVDVVLSNCVLNLVGQDERRQLFSEMYRVVKDGGRVAISDIVCDRDVPQHLQDDPELWSGCISGAFREDAFMQAFADAGFHGVQLVKRDATPWRSVEGIEFRAVTVVAYKGKAGPCEFSGKHVVYAGPWSEIHDDDGHAFQRGVPTEVCDKTHRLLMRAPYIGQFVDVDHQAPFSAADQGEAGCTPGGGCC